MYIIEILAKEAGFSISEEIFTVVWLVVIAVMGIFGVMLINGKCTWFIKEEPEGKLSVEEIRKFVGMNMTACAVTAFLLLFTSEYYPQFCVESMIGGVLLLAVFCAYVWLAKPYKNKEVEKK